MTETEEVAVEIFRKADEFWKEDSHEGLTTLAVANIGRVLEYAKTDEGKAAIELRAKQLDTSISHFNKKKVNNSFSAYEVNSIRLATEILKAHEKLPLIAETPADTQTLLPYFLGFRRLAGTYESSKTHYYTFLDKSEARSQEELNTLITGLLVDGFSGLAFRARKVAEGSPSAIGHGDLIAVNAICEMVEPGELQTEMYKANWYKPDYGLTPEFCEKIDRQFASRTSN